LVFALRLCASNERRNDQGFSAEPLKSADGTDFQRDLLNAGEMLPLLLTVHHIIGLKSFPENIGKLMKLAFIVIE
jgi:hypothetical protein